MATATAARPSGFLRWAGLGGLLYVVLTIVGLFLILHDLPAGDAPPSKVIPYFQDSGHRTRIGIGWILIVVGVFFLFWFVAALRELVRAYAGDGLLATVATIGGAVYAALTLAAFSIEQGILTMTDDTYRHGVDPLLVHSANDVGYVLHSAGGAAIGAAIVAVSLAALGARAIPAWLGWLSFVAGIVAVFSITFFPWIVIAVWLAIASVLVTRALGRLSAGVAPG
ncbi:MAG TPA: hypothetical protein VF101_19005 [Gaiellaceae bacterium]